MRGLRDVDESKYRSRKGPKPWNSLYESKVDTRISAADNNALNRLAEERGVSRSTIIRKALHDFIKFNTDDKEEDPK